MEMLQYIIYLVTLLNPVALFIYLLPLKQERGMNEYTKILFRANLIAFVTYAVFAIFGEAIFTKLFRIEFSSCRLFGGLVLLGFAFGSIVQGKKSLIATKGEMNDIATQIAMPFIVGAGTIAMSIIMGKALGPVVALFSIASVMAISFAIVLTLALIRQSMSKNMRTGLDQTLNVVLRLNGFFVGSIGVDLVVTSLKNIFG